MNYAFIYDTMFVHFCKHFPPDVCPCMQILNLLKHTFQHISCDNRQVIQHLLVKKYRKGGKVLQKFTIVGTISYRRQDKQYRTQHVEINL